MVLVFCCVCVDCVLGDEVGNVLWAQQVEEFCGGGQIEGVDVKQELLCSVQFFIDVEVVVQMWIIDVVFLIDCCVWFFKVDVYYDQQVVFQCIGCSFEVVCVIECLVVIVD